MIGYTDTVVLVLNIYHQVTLSPSTHNTAILTHHLIFDLSANLILFYSHPYLDFRGYYNVQANSDPGKLTVRRIHWSLKNRKSLQSSVVVEAHGEFFIFRRRSPCTNVSLRRITGDIILLSCFRVDITKRGWKTIENELELYVTTTRTSHGSLCTAVSAAAAVDVSKFE